MVSPVRQVTRVVAVGLGVFVAEGVLVGPRVEVGMDRWVAVGNGRRVAVGRGRVAVGGNVGVASGESNPLPEMLTGETVALGKDGCSVAVAVLVARAAGVELVVGVKVGVAVAVGCGVSVVRATRPSRTVPTIRATTARKTQPAKTTRVSKPPPATNNRRASRRVCGSSAAL
jgi:hypothetical protein